MLRICNIGRWPICPTPHARLRLAQTCHVRQHRVPITNVGTSILRMRVQGKRGIGTPDGVVFDDMFDEIGKSTLEWKTGNSLDEQEFMQLYKEVTKVLSSHDVPARFIWPSDNSALSKVIKILCQVCCLRIRALSLHDHVLL